MGYPIFGKVKTITLPIDYNEYTLDQYKEKFGIDLKPYIKLKDNRIIFNIDDCLLLINDPAVRSYAIAIVSNIFVPTVFSLTPLDAENEQDASLAITDNDGVGGILMDISHEEEFSIENIKIREINM